MTTAQRKSLALPKGYGIRNGGMRSGEFTRSHPHTGHVDGTEKQKIFVFLSQCWKHRIPGSLPLIPDDGDLDGEKTGGSFSGRSFVIPTTSIRPMRTEKFSVASSAAMKWSC